MQNKVVFPAEINPAVLERRAGDALFAQVGLADALALFAALGSTIHAFPSSPIRYSRLPTRLGEALKVARRSPPPRACRP